jgi:hypothetical protein
VNRVGDGLRMLVDLFSIRLRHRKSPGPEDLGT